VGGQVFRAIGLGAQHSCALDATPSSGAGATTPSSSSVRSRAARARCPCRCSPRAPLRQPASGAIPARSLFDAFDDGNWTAGPAWLVDSAPGATAAMDADRTVEITPRRTGRYSGPGAGLALPVRIPVRPATTIQFDVMVLADSLRTGCGLNCASWPASVRVRVKNTDLTESEAWYVYGDKGGAGRALGNVVIVARGDARAGTWLKSEQLPDPRGPPPRRHRPRGRDRRRRRRTSERGSTTSSSRCRPPRRSS